MENISEIASRVIEPKKCTACGLEFITDPDLPLAWSMRIAQCGSCVEKELTRNANEYERQYRLEQQERFQKAWLTTCPPIFHDTDPEKLPCQTAYKDVLAWKYGEKGLVLHGPSGKGKSRCAWLLIKRERDARKSFMVLDSMAGLKYASKFNRGADEVESWIEELIATDLLFMDDIFKNKLTDSFEGVIFTLIDQRIQQRKPVILTSNDTGKTLASRMTEDRAEPLIRRIREHSTTVNFY